MQMLYKGFDDKWIIANRKNYSRWVDMYKDYCECHPGTKYPVSTFRTHCSTDLGLTFRYTKEQEDWLRNNYPHLGARETQKRFLETFGIKRGLCGIRTKCNDLGLIETEERKKAWRAENGKRKAVPVGSKHISEGGVPFVKTENGWQRCSYVNAGNVPKNHQVVHLDGDKQNNDKDNLAVISKQDGAKMTAYKFWSVDRNITKAGIMCCQLETILENRIIHEKEKRI